jgi:hypothetical protein
MRTRKTLREKESARGCRKGKTQRTEFATGANVGQGEKCDHSRTVCAAAILKKGTKLVTPQTLEWDV